MPEAPPVRTGRVPSAAIVLLAATGAFLLACGSSHAMRSTPISERPATFFVSPNGSDAGRCSRSAPCRTFGAAYQRAQPGQVVEIAGGTYPTQTIANRGAFRNLRPGCSPAEQSHCIVFRPAKGATVNIAGSLQVNASSVWIKGSSAGEGMARRGIDHSIRVSGYADIEATSTSNFPDHVVLQGISSTSFGVFGVDTALLRDMDVGPATVGANCTILQGPGFENKIGFAGGVTKVPHNVTLDHIVVHNQNRNADGGASDCHFGGLFVTTADGLTIENSIFSQNAVYNIQVQNFDNAPPPRNVIIQNNWFGCPTLWLTQAGGERQCDNQADIQFNAATTFSNWLIRYNSFGGGVGAYVDGATFQNVRVVGNAGSRPQSCFPGVTFAYNAWDGRRCSPTDRTLRGPIFVATNPGAENFRLAPTSGARSLVPPTSSDSRLGVDMAGHARPASYLRDAGALERDTALLVPGRSIGSAVIGMHESALKAAYGPALRSTAIRSGATATPARLETFAIPGGRLRATVVDDRVAGLATTSPFYSTPRGVGPGSLYAAAARAGRGAWIACAHALRYSVGSVTVSFVSTAAKQKITGVEMVRPSLLRPCAGR